MKHVKSSLNYFDKNLKPDNVEVKSFNDVMMDIRALKIYGFTGVKSKTCFYIISIKNFNEFYGTRISKVDLITTFKFMQSEIENVYNSNSLMEFECREDLAQFMNEIS